MKTKERPILFSGPMVRAILAGTKTQTRRVVKPQPTSIVDGAVGQLDHDGDWVWYRGRFPVAGAKNRFGRRGDLLWVRETFAILDALGDPTKDRSGTPVWREGYFGCTKPEWRSPIYMPRWASRLTLEVVSVRVERLCEISEADARAEGITLRGITRFEGECRLEYVQLWESINGLSSWALNPWVWVVEFSRKKT